MNPGNVGNMYWDGPSSPLYPFGYGLSYTTFTISDLKLNTPQVAAGSPLEVSVTVKNTGPYAADQVVELYTHQRAGSASRPIRELKGFRRVTLQPGESKPVTLTLDTHDLGFWSTATRTFAIEPGTFDLWVGDSSTSTANHATFEVIRP